jgi:NADPH:quinone reductase-like Zn-dependent oxidoreductase
MLKAVRFSQFGGPEVLEIVDLPDPHPGPGQVRIAVRAAGVNPSDWKKRKGLMDSELPQTLGYEAAGVVDELGEGVADVAVGDRVFGFSADGAAQAELAVLSWYAPIPPSLDFPGAAALPAAVETATRALDQLASGGESWSGRTLLINGASGSVGSAAVQLAVLRGARVIGTASPANHTYLRSLGAEPVAYGEGLVERVRALAPDGVDLALDVAGSGVLPELIELVGGPEHVVTIADFGGAQEYGVRFSRGDTGRALYALAGIGELIESGGSRCRSRRPSRSPRSRRRTASARTVTCAGSSCWWPAPPGDVRRALSWWHGYLRVPGPAASLDCSISAGPSG